MNFDEKPSVEIGPCQLGLPLYGNEPDITKIIRPQQIQTRSQFHKVEFTQVFEKIIKIQEYPSQIPQFECLPGTGVPLSIHLSYPLGGLVRREILIVRLKLWVVTSIFKKRMKNKISFTIIEIN